MRTPLFPTTAGLVKGMKVRFILDYAQGQPLVREGEIDALEGTHHVQIAYLSIRPTRLPPRRLVEPHIDSRRILEVID